MSTEDLEEYEAELELALYREYRDVVGLFTYVVETEPFLFSQSGGPQGSSKRWRSLFRIDFA